MKKVAGTRMLSLFQALVITSGGCRMFRSEMQLTRKPDGFGLGLDHDHDHDQLVLHPIGGPNSGHIA
jgi:hypothetical protein